MNRLDASGIRKVFDLAAKMTDPINLSIGQPDFEMPAQIRHAAAEAIHSGKNTYTQTEGIPALRVALQTRLSEELGRDVPPVLITSGVSGALVLSMLSLVEPGDEVLLGDPYFVMYKHLIHLTGGKPVFFDTYPDFRLRREALERAVTERTKILILNSPGNPSGVVHSREEVAMAVAFAREHDLLIISDEIYDLFSYESPAYSPGAEYADTLILRGFSKTFAMTGWRLGYVAGPEAIIEKMAVLQQYSFVCAPAPGQHAVLAALEYEMTPHIESYAEKRNFVYNRLKDRFEVVRPGGAFYIFPKAPGGQGAAFVEKAIENNVLIIPGSVFSERDTHFRISYATSMNQLEKGMDILCRLADS